MSHTTPPTRHESANALVQALIELAQLPRLLVALDFDGTLAPFVDDPVRSRTLPEAKAALDRLEQLPNTWVAYVSGRPLESLARVTEADDDALLIGSHGVEVRFGADGDDLQLTEDERNRLARLGALLEHIVANAPGAELERKPVGFGIHTRKLAAEHARAVNQAALEAAAQVGGHLTVRDGKDILEFAVREANKGDGLERLRDHVQASAILFAGDDVTDEDGFAALRPGDIGIKVGDGETKAQFRVADPQAIATMLGLLADARERWVSPNPANRD
ncbi:MAG: trehalose 6-phosphate phosphatase [Microbacteriaceae bacterium]|jgi:trehalose 6-phosphate phosphatase|nr:trehalose 6-phosphate phosphatase [Microbacteriaceae bacterium]